MISTRLTSSIDLPGRLERHRAGVRRRAREVREVVGDVALREDRRQRLEAALAAANSSEQTITQLAPSLTPGALPAVVVPSGSNTGFSAASFSTVVSRRTALVGGDVADGHDLVVEAAGVLRGRGTLVRPRAPTHPAARA